MKCKVSVIVPVYNCKSLLNNAVDSVINQNDFNENEIILIDDGSTDGSSEICDEYGAQYRNIKVIHQKNSGVSVARNNGIKHAEGEWLFFLDSDDYLLDDAFEKMLAKSNADFICANYDSNASERSSFESVIECGKYKTKQIKEQIEELLSSNNQFFFTCWSKLFKRSFVVDNNIEFPVDRKYAEDMVFVYTYLRFCETISFVDDSAYFYYVNDNNATSIILNSFDTVYFVYVWQTEYFKDIGSYNEKIRSRLVSVFLYGTFLSLKTAAMYLGYKDSVKYIKHILSNDDFYSLYVNGDDYKTFKTPADAMLDKFIRKKNAFLIYFLYKVIKLKSLFVRFLR